MYNCIKKCRIVTAVASLSSNDQLIKYIKARAITLIVLHYLISLYELTVLIPINQINIY